MFIKKESNSMPLLADMHLDGTRFDPEILEAMRAMRANNLEEKVNNS